MLHYICNMYMSRIHVHVCNMYMYVTRTCMYTCCITYVTLIRVTYKCNICNVQSVYLDIYVCEYVCVYMYVYAICNRYAYVICSVQHVCICSVNVYAICGK